MDFAFSEDQIAIKDSVAKLCAQFDDKYWLKKDKEGGFPADFYQAMADAGWLGIAMPEEYGGAGLGITEAALLMQAVAEEAQRRFRAEIEAALAEAPLSDPLGRFRCLGLAYLRWAMRNPTHFEIISSRKFFDHDASAGVSRDNSELIELTERTLADAFAAGQLRSGDLKRVQIAGRALVYGFARMNIDGHFPRWGVAGTEAEKTAESILDLFIEGIAKR